MPSTPAQEVWPYAMAVLLAFAVAILVVAAIGISAVGLVWLIRLIFGKSAIVGLLEPSENRRSFLVIFSLVSLIIFGLVVVVFIPKLATTGQWIPIDLFGLGIMLSSGLFGFVFGLPRLNPTLVPAQSHSGNSGAVGVPSGPVLTPNTNLEQISDRFTTLLTGVAFAQILTVPAFLRKFSDYFPQIVGTDVIAAKLLGVAVLLYFAPLGFIVAYIVTRTVGAQAFARSDLALFQQYGLSLASLPPMPDVPENPTPEQRNAAATIANYPLSSLTTYSQKAAWARAQTILGHIKDAELGYQAAYVMDDSDPQLLVDYATVLYNDLDWKDLSYVRWLASRAKLLAGANEYDLCARILSLIAAADLYRSDGGYIDMILTVNSLLANDCLSPRRTSRFYRACAFGQLYWSYDASGKLEAADKAAVSDFINRDAAVTLAFGPEMRDQLLIVTDPEHRPKSQPEDNDLQYFACFDDNLRALLGLKAAPPLPTEAPPPLVTLPSGFAKVADFVASCPK